MATAQTTCPNCGAPIDFALGSTLAKVCEYCRHTVVRSDRGLEQLGKVADLALTPALIAVGDDGSLAGRPLRVLGRVQLDYGEGPWDEYYVGFDNGQSFGWLAYAQGEWFVTSLAPGVGAPAYGGLGLEQDVTLAGNSFRVAEIKQARVLSIEGEFHALIRPGMARLYADCWGKNHTFATLDYGEGNEAVSVFLGWVFPEAQLHVTALGPRSQQKVKSTTLRCPNCGGDVPKLMGDRAERVGCPYCGAVSDIAAQRVVSLQEKARSEPDIPLSLKGTLGGQEYVNIAYMRRGTSFEGEPYSWEEYLLWSEPVGFRWLVKDPESGWTFVTPVNVADVERSPQSLTFDGRGFMLRNENVAHVEYVLGEVYWKCEVGETTNVADYTRGKDVVSREANSSEVHYSLSTPIAWPALALAFGVPVKGPGASFRGSGGGSAGRPSALLILVIVVLIVLLICAARACGGFSSGGLGGGSSYRGTGVFSGGK
jgi:ribosomal protein S27AE